MTQTIIGIAKSRRTPTSSIEATSDCTAEASQNHDHDPALGCLALLRAASTTTSGHKAWPPAAARSAKPPRLPRSSMTNQATRARSRPLTPTETSIRSGAVDVFRRDAKTGQAPSARNEDPAAIVCARELPSLGKGVPATNIVATPPPASTSRPAVLAGLSPSAVTTWQAPSAARAEGLS